MKRQVLLVFSLFFSVLSLCGEPIQTFRLDHITISDGLPNSSVSAIVQDSRGFMWFGTQSGLTRYDGYSFTTYLNDPFDSNSLPHNQIQTLFMDDNNILWIGTYNGLCRYDIEKGIFTNYPSIDGDNTSLSNDVVVAIEKDSQGRLWVGTLNGLNLFDEENGSFTRFSHDGDNKFSIPDNTVRTILNDAEGVLWVGTYGGLSRWNENLGRFDTFSCSEDIIQLSIQQYKDSLGEDDISATRSDDFIMEKLGLSVDVTTIPSNYVMTLKQHPADRNILIVGTWEGKTSPGGVAFFNTSTLKAERLDTIDNRVYSLLTDERNKLWIGTWGGGLVLYDLTDGGMNHFYTGNNSEISHDIIYSLYRDHSGVVWIGTNGGGIDKYVDWKNLYKFYKNDPESPFSLPPGKVNSAMEDSFGNIWFAVQGHGISRFNPDTGLFKNYESEVSNPKSLSNSLVNAVYEDSKLNLWVGTNNGLNLYNRVSDDFERFYSGKGETSLPDNLIYSIAEDHEGNLWLGSYTRGIFVRSPDTGIYTYYENDKNDPTSLSDNLIRSLFVDSTGTVWACTNKGLNRFNPRNGSFIRYLHDAEDRNSISSNDVRRIYEDSSGNLWIATNGGGVNLYDRASDSFSLLSSADGLLSNSVMAIGEDEEGRLLFVTIPGISIYNPKDHSFSVIDKKTGLLSSELTSGFLKASDGSLYIGGTNGITYIPKLQLQTVTYKPMVNINSIEVLGVPYDQDGRAAWSLNNLILDYGENTIGFEFTLSDYSSAGQNQFAYKLEGVDSDWVYSGFRNFARYTNLNPGSYIFKVIGADSRNNWNMEGSSVSFTIKPPFWRSYFAYLTYIILFILLFLLIYLRIKNRQDEAIRKMEEQKALNLELENRVRKRTAQIEEARRIAEDATKAKSLFLANMSHELRTPLNAVVGFSELLNEEDYSPEKRHIITSIKTAGKSLSTLINDLLDLSKLEAGKMTIKKSAVDISRVIFEIRHIFNLRVREKGLEFILDIDPEIPEEVLIDETRFRQILINLTGNSIKFTNEGFVKIALKVLQKNVNNNSIDLKIDVSDTGCGISEQNLQKIFDLFWQSESRDLNKPAGTGLGLSICKNLAMLMNGSIDVKSELDKGTTVTVVFKDLPIPSSDSRKKSREARKNLKSNRFNDVKVVVTDDIADNRNLLLEILKQMDIEAFPAENGKEAIEVISKEKPDIVFMDLQMPVMDGYTAAKKLKESLQTQSIPVVAVTASLQNELFNKEGGKINYFSDYITKPYSIDSIREVLVHLVGHKLRDNLNSVKSPDMRKVTMQAGDIDDLDNLIIKLEEFKSEWKNLKPSGRMSRLENFGVRLREVGKRHNASDLIDYAEIFLASIKVFDLKSIEKELNQFPGIIEKFKDL
ncbi:two-component regulator propeller domain-containing protein [Spirochaeta isovalerica]|uniref:histidine kinase n=1 Tax=Spirochaeta isovalerica TaxID=150 RepID=A0A841R7L8_9SPIO|nr:two-component regulator propeller domain-containing protein [Spirochaeta isovalerica]MBB6478738.1 signal transduction histidine kinase/ligand-binding sensor domain-containing protein/CheY-like chemotaxis protein [Spirochaeta isovalerica]